MKSFKTAYEPGPTIKHIEEALSYCPDKVAETAGGKLNISNI